LVAVLSNRELELAESAVRGFLRMELEGEVDEGRDLRKELAGLLKGKKRVQQEEDEDE
jgi:hypothetical protein